MECVAFTGPEDVGYEAYDYIEHTIRNLPRFTCYVSGGAYGVDSFAALIAYRKFPDAEHKIYYPDDEGNRYNKRLVQVLGRRPNVCIRGIKGGYMKRNDALVKAADILVAFPETSTEQLRSGTWATIRRARTSGVPVWLFPLNQA